MENDKQALLAGIDAGGTTYKCAIADLNGDILSSERIPVTTPEETLSLAIACIKSRVNALNGDLKRVGVASFGPLDINPKSPHYGTVLSTPKPHWSNTPVRRVLAEVLKVDVNVDTDVNAALAAEIKWGAAKDRSSAAYFTVGTGIGAGFYNGKGFIGAPTHPEVGHIRVSRHPQDTAFKGVCAFHKDCLEGLASATAIRQRVGEPKALSDDHEMWDIEAYYLAQACLSTFLFMRPEVILLGGGVMLRKCLLDKTREQFAELNAEYISGVDVEALIQRPLLGDDAGLKGGVFLAMQAA